MCNNIWQGNKLNDLKKKGKTFLLYPLLYLEILLLKSSGHLRALFTHFYTTQYCHDPVERYDLFCKFQNLHTL